MIKLNKTVFELSHLYSSFTQAKTWDLLNTLTTVKGDLEELEIDIIENRLFEAHYLDELVAVQTQLYYVNKNIKTVGDALLCHETKVFEKRLSLKDLHVFCLN